MTTFSSPGDEYRPSQFQSSNRNILFFHTIKTTFFETLKMIDSKKVVFIDHTESNYFSIHFPKNQQNCWFFMYFDEKISKKVKTIAPLNIPIFWYFHFCNGCNLRIFWCCWFSLLFQPFLSNFDKKSS